MKSIFNRTGTVSFLVNVGIAVALCLAINALIFGSGWDNSDPADDPVWFAPPGLVVGAVWVILSGLIGAARYFLNESGEAAKAAKMWLVALLLFCLAYPIYTIGFGSKLIGLFGNIATIALTVYAARRARRFSKIAALLLVPQIFWVSFATLIILAELGWI